MRNPLWRKAPFTLVRYRGLLVALAGGAALLAAAAAASPLFVSASGSAALRDEIKHSTAYGAGLYVAATATPHAPPEAHASNFDDRVNTLNDELEAIPEVGPLVSTQLLPEVTASLAGKEGSTIGIRPLSRTDALDHITLTSGSDDGLLLANETAKVLGAKAGDTLLLDSGAGAKTKVRISGIYTALYEQPPTPYWRSLHN